MAHTLVLLRHGQSVWNLENRFTGWQDVDLTEVGQAEAHEAGRLLAAEGLAFDLAFSSVLKRAIRTLWITLAELDLMWIPQHCRWALNERHYGALTGLDKQKAVREHGADQVQLWRRSFDVPPPGLDWDDPRHARFDPRYAHLDSQALPSGECLADCLKRVLPLWRAEILPAVLAGQKVLIAAHGNSLRALVMHLDGLTPTAISQLNIPTGVPLVYELDDGGQALSHRYLGDSEAISAAIKAVVDQTAPEGG